jgi:UDPglucose 6-dehydrogenase
MNVSIVGTGHVGLVTGACLAELGNAVLCVDSDAAKLENIQRGVMPFYEPGLEELVRLNTISGRLRFGATVRDAVEWANVVFICAGTPSNEDGSADISSIEQIAQEIAAEAKGYCLLVEKSTVPVRTGERLRANLDKHGNAHGDFDLASVPEFLREGSAINDTLHPDRIVIGTDTERAAGILKELFQPTKAPVLMTDINTAEVIKHASNSFLAMKISYINAVASICEQTGADVTTVARAVGMDHRIGLEFLEAGVGYGGSCFPKDVAAFIQVAQSAGLDFGMLREVQRVNQDQPSRMVAKLRTVLGGLRGRHIAMLGLAFKPNTDDIREAPAMGIIELLLGEGATVKAYDPQAMRNARTVLGERIAYGTDAYDAAGGADALTLITQWDEFKALDWPRMRRLLRTPTVVDGRNLWEPSKLREAGFSYLGVGR